MHALPMGLAALVDMKMSKYEFEEHGEDGDYCEDGDVPYYCGCGIRGSGARRAHITNGDPGRIPVEYVKRRGASNEAEEDYGCAGVSALDKEDQDHEG